MGVETCDQSEPVKNGRVLITDSGLGELITDSGLGELITDSGLGELITDSGLGEKTPCHEDLHLPVSLQSCLVNLHFLKVLMIYRQFVKTSLFMHY